MRLYRNFKLNKGTKIKFVEHLKFTKRSPEYTKLHNLIENKNYTVDCAFGDSVRLKEVRGENFPIKCFELMDKVYIKLVITKTNKFRVNIKEPNEVAYEVTVGGEEWNKGKGRKYESEIIAKIQKRIEDLAEQFSDIKGSPFIFE